MKEPVGMFRPAICLMACAWPALVLAAPPTISKLSVRGLQVDGTTRVVVNGANLLPSPRLVAGVPVAGQKVVGTPTANVVMFDVTLGGSVVPGAYHLRVLSGQGVSKPKVITVDHLPQRVFSADTRTDVLPVALHGQLSGSQVGTAQFVGKSGQRISIDLMARRLGSTLRPVLHLLGPDRRRLKLGMPRLDLSGDSRITLTLPRDGRYTIQCHDLQYAVGNPGNFRLSIGSFDVADLAYPAAVTRGQVREVLLLGTGDRETAVRVKVPRMAHGLTPIEWGAKVMPLGLRPRVEVSRWPEVVEPASPGKTGVSGELPSIPSAANGRLVDLGEVDSWKVPVKQGEKLRFEVFADRLGTPLDSMLELKKPDGGVLSANDDAVRADSRLDFTVPAKLSHVFASISDRHGRGGRRFLYRLVVTRTTDPTPSDFDLLVENNSFNVLPDGRHVFRVDVVRRGYDGEIRLEVLGAPSHFKLLTPSIPAGAPGALVTVVNTATNAGNALDGFSLVGASTVEGTSIRRPVRVVTHPLAGSQPWLRDDLAIGRVVVKSPAVAIGVQPVPSLALWQGQEVVLPVRLTRDPEAVGPVRLSLVTSQKIPLVKGKPNGAAAIRGTAATVDIPVPAAVTAARIAVNKSRAALAALEKKAVAAGDSLKDQLTKARSVRDATVKTFHDAVAAWSRDATYRVTVPPGLPLSGYDLSVVAELRSTDNKTALTRSFSPVLRLAAKRSLEIAPRSESVVRATRTPKVDVTVRLRGEVVRHGGFGGDITVSVAGVPKGLPVPKVVIKSGQKRFDLPLKIPAKFTATRFANLLLVVSGPPNPKTPKVLVTARQEFSLELEANGEGSPPPPPGVRTIGR